MLSFICGLCALFIVPVFLGTFWIQHIEEKKRIHIDEIIYGGVVLYLAGFTVLDKLAHHMGVSMGHLMALVKVLAIIGTILFFALECRAFVQVFRHDLRHAASVAVPSSESSGFGSSASVKADLSAAEEWQNSGQSTLTPWVSRILLIAGSVVLVFLMNPARYRGEATHILSGGLTQPRALDDFYYILSEMFAPLIGSGRSGFLLYGMQLVWMVPEACLYHRMGRMLFQSRREQRIFLWVLALIFLVPVFYPAWDSLGFYTNLWRKDTLLCVFFAPLYFALMYAMYRYVRDKKRRGEVQILIYLLILSIAAFSCSRISLLYLAITLFVAIVTGLVGRIVNRSNRVPQDADRRRQS